MCLVCVATAGMSLLMPTGIAPHADVTHTYAEPVDALSVGLATEHDHASVSYFANGVWSDWKLLGVENEQDPSLKESSLLVFPEPVSQLRLRSESGLAVVHPIRVTRDAVRVEVASTLAANTSVPRILSRREWGADDSLLYVAPTTEKSDANVSAGDNGSSTTVSQRVHDCQEAQKNYPEEFKVQSTVNTDASGRSYRWPLSYSKEVHLLTVHHTALYISDDSRPPVERMRALYQYHAENRGWGDIGYNYVIDEKGQIYEGRQGGRGVVGGHAYCNNVGTMGIALMGNFELEQPSQAQVQSLQWLLKELSDTYDINPDVGVVHHGKKFVTPYVGHRDLVSTDCPGYYMYNAMGQVTANVRSGNVAATVKFPATTKTTKKTTSSTPPPVARGITKVSEGLEAVGRTGLALAPGSKQRITLLYTAPQTGVHANGRIAQVALSSSDIVIVQEVGNKQIPVKTSLSSEYDVPGGDQLTISLLIQAPWDTGSYWFEIGGIKYTLQTSGRRSRAESYANPFAQRASISSSAPAPVQRRVRPQVSVPTVTTPKSSVRSITLPNFTIALPSVARIRLSASATPTVRYENGGIVAGNQVLPNATVQLSVNGNTCRAQAPGIDTSAAAISLAPTAGTATVDTVNGKTRRYRGTLECRAIDGQLVLINSIGLEEYLRGLAEEPDSEPYEKQRAFAVAARTYMAYWMQSEKRKFPGMPYDGTDSPVTFQAYGGYDLEVVNPKWVKAVDATNSNVLTFNNQLVRPPYFSSDDGRTRTPEEAGWNNFPFSQELFRSKPDPWCNGFPMAGHGVGMSGCGAEGQAHEGKTAEQILQYYYPGAVVRSLTRN